MPWIRTGGAWEAHATCRGVWHRSSRAAPFQPKETITARVPAGVVFADLGGSEPPVEVQSAVRFVDCTFTDNDVTGINDGVILAAGLSEEVWLQGCQFVNNTATLELVASSSSVFYNDGPEKYYAGADSAEVQPQKTPPDASAFLALPDDFVTDASGVRCLLLILCQMCWPP